MKTISYTELTIFCWGAGFGIRTGDSMKYSCIAAGLWSSLKEYANDRSSFNQLGGRLDKYLERKSIKSHLKNCHKFTKNSVPLPCSSPAPRPGCLWTMGSLGSLWGEVKSQMVLIPESLQGSEKAKGRLGQGWQWLHGETNLELIQSSWALALHTCGKADV